MEKVSCIWISLENNVYKMPINKFFGLEGEILPNHAPPAKEEC